MEHNNPNRMHQPPPPPHMRAPRKITTEEVQSYLDWNKTLIMEIREKMNLGKLAECAEHQERLQQNLMYLAAIADWEQKPQTPMVSPQLTVPLGMQPEYHMERPRSVTMPQQQGIFPLNMPWQFDNPHDQLDQQAQEQGIFRPNMSLQFGNPQHQHSAARGAGSSGGQPSTAGPNDALGGSGQAASEGGDDQGNSAASHNQSDIVLSEGLSDMLSFWLH